MYIDREMLLVHRQWNWGSNSFSFSLTFGNPIKTTRGKAWGILGTTRDVVISIWLQTWARWEVRDEFVAIGVRVNVYGSLEDHIGINFGVFNAF